MSILGAILLFFSSIYIGISILNKNVSNCRWNLFKIMILSSIFLVLGYVLNIGIYLQYWRLFMYEYIFISFIDIYTTGKNIKIKKNVLMSSILLLISCICGFLYLAIGYNVPQIIPPNIGYDCYALGLEYPFKTATFTSKNLSTIVYLLSLIFTSWLSLDYFYDKNKVVDFINTFKKVFYVYFSIMILEIISGYLFGGDFFRNLVISIMGPDDIDNSFSPYIFRNGLFGAAVFFPETSYNYVILYYIIMCLIMGVSSKVNCIFFYVSLMLLIICGSSSTIALVPLWLVAAVRVLYSRKYIIYQYSMIAIIISIFLCAFSMYGDIIIFALESYIEKIEAFISGTSYGTYMADSGAARGVGNNLAMKVFFDCPLFGIGIGTMWAYGLVPSALSNLGILGVLSYLYFITSICKCDLNKVSIMMFIVFCMYFYGMGSANMLYSPTILGIGMLFLQCSDYIKFRS